MGTGDLHRTPPEETAVETSFKPFFQVEHPDLANA